MKAILPAILSCQGTALSDEEKYFFAKSNPLGINLFARNISNKEQIKTLLTEIKTAIGRDDILIAIDQEGGRVRRLAEPEFRSYTSAFNLGSLPLEEAKKPAPHRWPDLRTWHHNFCYHPVNPWYSQDPLPS